METFKIKMDHGYKKVGNPCTKVYGSMRLSQLNSDQLLTESAVKWLNAVA